VFFGNPTTPDHVGIYAGSQTVWDALNEQSVVQIHTFAQTGLPFVGGVRYWKDASRSDFNGDGRDDIAFFRASAGNFAIASGGKTGLTEAGTQLNGWGTPTWGGVGDFDGDGDSDIAFFRASAGNFAIAYGGKTGLTEAGTQLNGWGTPTWGGVGDFDGDGDSDIAFFRASAGNFAIAYGGSSSLTEVGTQLSAWGTPDWANGSYPDTAGMGFSRPAVLTVPGPPTGVVAHAGNGHATISFTPSASTGGAVISGYTVTATPGGHSASGSASPIAVEGLENGTSYTFTVRATNSAGTGPPSTPSNAVIPTDGRPEVPDPPPESARPPTPSFVTPTGPRPPRPEH
jgi:hypothetical protein